MEIGPHDIRHCYYSLRQCLESKDNKGLTWSAVVKRCFPGEHATNMKTCYDTRADDLLKKVCWQ